MKALAEAMGAKVDTVKVAASGRGAVSAGIALRAARARSVVHFLQKKKRLAIVRAATGKFVLLRPATASGSTTSVPQSAGSLALPAGGGSK